jgi:hypothetical protein
MRDYRRERHSVSRLIVHLVWVTKYRRQGFDAAALEWLAGHARQLRAKLVCRLLASNGEADHLHILVPADQFGFGAGQCLQGHVKSKASPEPARHHLSLSRRCSAVAGLFRCVGRRRVTEAAQLLLALVWRRLPRAENLATTQAVHSSPCLLLPSRRVTIHPTPRQQTLFATCFP